VYIAVFALRANEPAQYGALDAKPVHRAVCPSGITHLQGDQPQPLDMKSHPHKLFQAPSLEDGIVPLHVSNCQEAHPTLLEAYLGRFAVCKSYAHKLGVFPPHVFELALIPIHIHELGRFPFKRLELAPDETHTF
jgi:hypothetical protein